jgi:hypothetical protein
LSARWHSTRTKYQFIAFENQERAILTRIVEDYVCYQTPEEEYPHALVFSDYTQQPSVRTDDVLGSCSGSTLLPLEKMLTTEIDFAALSAMNRSKGCSFTDYKGLSTLGLVLKHKVH